MHEWLKERSREELEKIMADSSSCVELRLNAKNVLDFGDTVDYLQCPIVSIEPGFFDKPDPEIDRIGTSIELRILDFFLDVGFEEYAIFDDQKFKGFPPYGIVLDTLNHLVRNVDNLKLFLK